MSGIFESKRGGGQFQCKGTTRLGKKCKIKCESIFCYHHQFQELPKKEECSICLEPIKNKLKLDCKHKFCKNCILKWFCNNQSCPSCRNINKNEELKKLSFSYGLNNKYICKVVEYKINISELDKSELDKSEKIKNKEIEKFVENDDILRVELYPNSILFVPNYWYVCIKGLEKSIIEKVQYKTILNEVNFLYDRINHSTIL